MIEFRGETNSKLEMWNRLTKKVFRWTFVVDWRMEILEFLSEMKNRNVDFRRFCFVFYSMWMKWNDGSLKMVENVVEFVSFRWSMGRLISNFQRNLKPFRNEPSPCSTLIIQVKMILIENEHDFVFSKMSKMFNRWSSMKILRFAFYLSISRLPSLS